MKTTCFDRTSYNDRVDVHPQMHCHNVENYLMNKLPECISWPILAVGAIVTMVLPLSVHAVMLQGLHVPYPYNFPHTGWARLPDAILSALGAIYLSAHLRQSTRKHSIGFRCALLFLLLASIHEDLFRGPFMEFINRSNFTLYPFIDNIPKLIPWAVVALGVELWISHERSLRANLIAAALLAIVVAPLVKPFANYAFAGVMHFTEAREGQQRYGLPYDWHILLPAYLTFFEPVLAALVIARAIRNDLPPESLTRFGITAALILALKGPVFAPLINIHYANTSPLTSVLSYAQFTFETMALGILTATTLHSASHAVKDASSALT
jgi:hypothetical protein